LQVSCSEQGAERIMIRDEPRVSEEAKPMSLLTVEGIYKDGKIELTERPERVDEAARVLVTFLPPDGPRE